MTFTPKPELETIMEENQNLISELKSTQEKIVSNNKKISESVYDYLKETKALKNYEWTTDHPNPEIYPLDLTLTSFDKGARTLINQILETTQSTYLVIGNDRNVAIYEEKKGYVEISITGTLTQTNQYLSDLGITKFKNEPIIKKTEILTEYRNELYRHLNQETKTVSSDDIDNIYKTIYKKYTKA